MKKKALICLGTLITTFGFSQSYEITDIGTNYNSTQIETTLSTANLCNWVYQTKSREIVLDDGTKIILLPNGSCGQLDDHAFAPVKWSINGTTLMIGHSYEPTLTKEQRQELKATKQ
ncbi:MAG: hypothetical protein P8M19_01360 [Crocinitomicaceae bacterium]|nr:hypothetical protein [Crocinitomicaceae bacterium]MDG2440292.1 hypothetical protein [Crocinitomicaceae bacterium]